jgi:hypothetical protein
MEGSLAIYPDDLLDIVVDHVVGVPTANASSRGSPELGIDFAGHFGFDVRRA